MVWIVDCLRNIYTHLNKLCVFVLNRLCRFCPLCPSCVSRRLQRQLLWRFPCWSSWLLSSYSAPTPPNSTRGLKGSSGLWWWDHFICPTLDAFLWMTALLSCLPQDFMRCVTASIIFFIVSIIAVSKYVDGSSKAAGVRMLVLQPTPPWFIGYSPRSFYPAANYFTGVTLMWNVLLLTDIWILCHHCVRLRFLPYF